MAITQHNCPTQLWRWLSVYWWQKITMLNRAADCLNWRQGRDMLWCDMLTVCAFAFHWSLVTFDVPYSPISCRVINIISLLQRGSQQCQDCFYCQDLKTGPHWVKVCTISPLNHTWTLTGTQPGPVKSTISRVFGSWPSDHYFRSVCWFVCLSVCLFVQFFSAVFDPISIKLGHMLYVWV